ncbi:MAG: PH domain-containing protein [Gemmatimonadota bacterium]
MGGKPNPERSLKVFESLKVWVLRFLRVPSEPELPVGSADAWVFRAAPNYYRYRLTLWAFAQVVALTGLVGGLVLLSGLIETVTHPMAVLGLKGAEALAWIAFLAQIPFSLAVVNLDFELRWYIVSDRSLRIREGIVSLREKTLTFANVQNVEIRRNPLQRYLGIADVRVRTAGGGGGNGDGKGQVGESMHEASFRGVDDPEKIRSAILERVRRQRDSGLGDPDDRGVGSEEPLRAAETLRREAGLLRAAFEHQGR